MIRGTAHGTDADTSGDFVLDTGAGYLALDRPLAERLRLIEGGGSADPVGLSQQPLRRLVLGDQSMDLVRPVLTIDGAIIRRVTDRRVLGLLGAKLYDDRAVQIDYPARAVRLIPATDPAAPPSGGEPANSQAVARSRRLLGRSIGRRAVAIPFTLAGDGKILLRARLGVSRFASSKPLTLILDTGATKTVLFRAAIDELGVGFERWPSLCGLSVPTLFGAPSACLVRMPPVTLEALVESDDTPQAGRTPNPTEAREARDPDGAAADATRVADAARAPAGRRMRPAVRAMLGDRAKEPAPEGAVEESPVADRTPSLAGAGGTTIPAAAAAAGAAFRSTTLRAEDLDAIVMESELQDVLSRVVETPVHGLLGYTFLRKYRVTIDYPQRVAWFEPATDPDPRPFEYSHPGIQLEREGEALRVVAVADGSPAARAKIAVGETLESVDGRAVAGNDLAQIARWLEGEPGTRVTLVIGSAAGSRTVSLTRRRLL